nr:hypothetical protein Iba_chr09cCG4400 [Ipomoea batatas]
MTLSGFWMVHQRIDKGLLSKSTKVSSFCMMRWVRNITGMSVLKLQCVKEFPVAMVYCLGRKVRLDHLQVLLKLHHLQIPHCHLRNLTERGVITVTFLVGIKMDYYSLLVNQSEYVLVL